MPKLVMVRRNPKRKKKPKRVTRLRATRRARSQGFIIGVLIEGKHHHLHPWYWDGERLVKGRRQAKVFVVKGDADSRAGILSHRGDPHMRAVMVLPA